MQNEANFSLCSGPALGLGENPSKPSELHGQAAAPNSCGCWLGLAVKRMEVCAFEAAGQVRMQQWAWPNSSLCRPGSSAHRNWPRREAILMKSTAAIRALVSDQQIRVALCCIVLASRRLAARVLPRENVTCRGRSASSIGKRSTGPHNELFGITISHPQASIGITDEVTPERTTRIFPNEIDQRPDIVYLPRFQMKLSGDLLGGLS